MKKAGAGAIFWTNYRRFVVETMLARGASRALIAERLGVTRPRLTYAIHRYGLTARDLLDVG